MSSLARSAHRAAVTRKGLARRIALLGLAVCLSVTWRGPAVAQDAGFEANHFHPAPNRDAAYLSTHAARILPQYGWSVGVMGNFARHPVRLVDPGSLSPSYAGPYTGNVLETQTTVHVLGAFSPMSFMEVGVDLPVVVQQDGEPRTGLESPAAIDGGAGLGDARLVPKLTVFDSKGLRSENRFWVAVATDVTFPTGDRERLQGGGSRVEPLLAAEWRSGFGARIGWNVGYSWRAHETRIEDRDVDSAFTWNLAVEVPVVRDQLALIGEAFEDLSRELLVGAKGRFDAFEISAAVGPGLRDDPVTPAWRGVLGVAFRAGPADAADADEDGVGDAVDQCPHEREDVDGFQDDDGCPDEDNDKDRIPDGIDRCPNTPEDVDGFQDDDGCPDEDNDRDGIVDVEDRCPTVPEDRDGFEDGDGCPEPDNDGDGVPDLQDRCPTDAEDPDGDNDEDGCPDVAPAVRVDVVIFFDKGSSEIRSVDTVQLDRVAETLKAMPNDLHVWIDGHADDTGSEELNQKLGQARADAVRQYLLEHGVPGGRMTAQTYGESKNIHLGKNDVDRFSNRRVEFRVAPRTLLKSESDAEANDGSDGRADGETDEAEK